MEIQHIAAFMANEAKKEFLGGFSRWPMFSMLYKNSRTPIWQGRSSMLKHY